MQTTKLFKGKKVRVVWDKNNKKWWISVIDICAVSCGSTYDVSRNYWKQFKRRLMLKNSRLVKTVHQIKMIAKDGKLRFTDVMDYKKVMQLIQILPCEKAEPIKGWIGSIAAKHCDLIKQLDVDELCAGVRVKELVRFRRARVCNIGKFAHTGK